MNETGNNSAQNRYSDEDLLEFKTLIDKKLANSREQVSQLEEQAMNLSESLQESGYDNGESHAFSNVEFLNTMITRQKKHIRDLELALLRIKNKAYGICILSGELIDKRRLLAVLTTTKSLQAKTEQQNKSKEPQRSRIEVNRTPKSDKPKVFSKIIKKFNPNSPVPISPSLEISDDDDDDDENDNDNELLDFEDGFDPVVDLNSIADDVEEEEDED